MGVRYIHFFGDAGFCGTEYHCFSKFTDDTHRLFHPELHLRYRLGNAESYEYLATGWNSDFDDDQEREIYYEGANGGWEELTKDRYEEEKERYGC